MQVSLETTSGLERRLTIDIPAEQIEPKVTERLKDAARTARIDGFRPGKVPMSVIKKRYGAGVRQEILQEAMQKSFYDAIVQEKLNPVGQPKIEPQVSESEGVRFVATFEIFPEIELQSLNGSSVIKPIAEVNDSDIDATIEELMKRERIWEETDSKVADGHKVTVDFEGFKEGETFEGGSATDYDLEIGSNSMIPGFETGLVDAEKGAEVELNLTFPENYHAKDLAGQNVVFKVTVKSIKSSKMPEINSDFFKKFGIESDSEEDFRAEVKKNMVRELNQAVRGKVKKQVMDALIANNDLTVPNTLLASEIQSMKEQAMQRFGNQAQQMNAPDLPDDLFKDEALKRVKLGLLINSAISKHSLKPEQEKVDAYLKEMASAYQDSDEVISWYKSNPEQLRRIESIVIEDVVTEKLLEECTVEDRPMGYKEATQPGDLTSESEAQPDDTKE